MTHWYATLVHYGEDEYCFVKLDGTNVRSDGTTEAIVEYYFEDSSDDFFKDLSAVLASGDEVTLCTSALGWGFAESEPDTLWRRLIRTYASSQYALKAAEQDQSLVGYFPTTMDYARPNQPCSVVLMPSGTLPAFYRYHYAVDPPFDPVNVGLLGCEVLQDDAMTRLLRSLSDPPSSADIDSFLRGKSSYLPVELQLKEKHVCLGFDIAWVMEKTSQTITRYDPGEFALQFREIIAKYREASEITAEKIAVIEMCRRYGVILSVANPPAE
jgi:hypothetical protein